LLLGFIPPPGLLTPEIGTFAGLLAIRSLIAQQLAPPPPDAQEEAQRSAVDDEVGAVAFDAQNASLESGSGDGQVDPADQEIGAGTGDGAGTPDGGTDPAKGDAPNGDTKGDAAESTVKPAGRTDLSRGNKAVPGKRAAKSSRQGAGQQVAAGGTTAGTATEPGVKDDDSDESGDKGSGAEGGDNTGGDNKTGDGGGDS
jgi:hypothetical protein